MPHQCTLHEHLVQVPEVYKTSVVNYKANTHEKGAKIKSDLPPSLMSLQNKMKKEITSEHQPPNCIKQKILSIPTVA